MAIVIGVYSVASSADWSSLEGSYQAKGQDGCAEKMEVSHQLVLGGINQLFFYSDHEGIRNQELALVEGEWISGPMDNPTYHYGYEIDTKQGNYLTYLRENKNHVIERKVFVRIGVKNNTNGAVTFFDYHDDVYASGQSLFCIYERMKRNQTQR